jgi:type VI secretion system secreted protein VgrG
MTGYTQVQQAMRVHTVLDEDMLLLEGLAGEEAVSKPYLFELDFVSLNRDIDGEQLLRTPMHVEIDLPDGSVRSIHGVVRRFVQRGRDGDLVSYRAEIVPWLWFLSLARDCRIFQGDDVLDIVEKVFKGQGYSDFENRCTRTYSKREYCVQYRESDLNFVSRLLEEEGIFYFFEHQDSKHVLVLADDMSSIKVCDGQPQARMRAEPVPGEDVVLSLDREHSVHSGKVTFGDYDYLQPTLTLRSTIAGDEPEEVYDYPGSFTDPDRGEERALLALEREEATRHVVRGSTTCRAFRTGTQFELQDHFGDAGDKTYAILELRHQARNGSYRSSAGGDGFDYRNELIAIPPSVPYRPPLRSRKSSVHGAQTAEVVGPGGEKIYVDEHGRVKVQFHWDRQGGKDHNSSCWVRVSQNWAGKNWGGMFIPHVGQEVIVDFLEGDPDRPIITGRVYNAKNAPRYDLPASKYKSVIHDDFGNEIVFDSTPGDPHIRIHSPSHASSLVLGRSSIMSTASDLLTFVEGKTGWIHKGATHGGTIGFKGLVDLAGSLSVFAGFKVACEVSQAASITIGPSFKFSKGAEYKQGATKFVQHVGKTILLNSDDQLFLIGGKNDESAIHGDAKGLSIQYGQNSASTNVRPNVVANAAFVAATVGGLTSAIIATQSWKGLDQGNGKTQQLSAPILGVGAAVAAAAAAILGKLTRKGTEPTFSGLHNTVHSGLKLDKDGVRIETGTTKLTIKKTGEVIINTKKTVAINGDKGVGIFSDKELSFLAPKVVATKGIFKSKNINDIGA